MSNFVPSHDIGTVCKANTSCNEVKSLCDTGTVCEARISYSDNLSGTETRGHTVADSRSNKYAVYVELMRNSDDNLETEDHHNGNSEVLTTAEVNECLIGYSEPSTSHDYVIMKPFYHKTSLAFSNPIYVKDRNDPPDKRIYMEAVLHLLRLDHLNAEEKANIISLVSNHSDRFHLPDEKLDATNAVQHFIPTINEVPIHTKQ